MMYNKKGFTSIEVVIVLIIITLISVFLLPGLSYFINKQDTQTSDEVNRTLHQAMVVYYGVIGDYPSDIRSLSNDHEDVSEALCNSIIQELYDVTGYQVLQGYSYDQYKMNIRVVNSYIKKIEIETR